MYILCFEMCSYHKTCRTRCRKIVAKIALANLACISVPNASKCHSNQQQVHIQPIYTTVYTIYYALFNLCHLDSFVITRGWDIEFALLNIINMQSVSLIMCLRVLITLFSAFFSVYFQQSFSQRLNNRAKSIFETQESR